MRKKNECNMYVSTCNLMGQGQEHAIYREKKSNGKYTKCSVSHKEMPFKIIMKYHFFAY